MKQAILHVVQGMAMGAAQVIPGISGATIALIFGIYDLFIELLYGFSQVVKEFLKLCVGKSSPAQVGKAVTDIPWKFGVFLVIGMGIAIAVLAGVLEVALDQYPRYVYGYFFGLVLASLSIPWLQIPRARLRHYGILVVSSIVFWIALGLKPAGPIEDPSLLTLAGGGALAISGMVLPGISGSLILLVMGLYDAVISDVRAITNLDTSVIASLGSFTLGIVGGFVIFVRLLKKALVAFGGSLMAFLTGLLVASLRVMWPFRDTTNDGWINPTSLPLGEMTTILLLIVAGIVSVIILKKSSPTITK